MIARLQKQGWNIGVRSIFDHPTIAALAALIEQSSGEGETYTVPPNVIPAECERITPEMLTLVSLGQEDIDRITRMVPGGARNIQDIYPLAPLQEGILFHQNVY